MLFTNNAAEPLSGHVLVRCRRVEQEERGFWRRQRENKVLTMARWRRNRAESREADFQGTLKDEERFGRGGQGTGLCSVVKFSGIPFPWGSVAGGELWGAAHLQAQHPGPSCSG